MAADLELVLAVFVPAKLETLLAERRRMERAGEIPPGG